MTPQPGGGGYDTHFYGAQSEALGSARKMLSYLFEHYRPASVVDVGCGIGAWLAAAHELGVGEILGNDGHDVVASGLLTIPRESFIEADLEQPLTVRQPADLCISVEVAEHLSTEHAASLVHEITSLAPSCSLARPFRVRTERTTSICNGRRSGWTCSSKVGT